MYVYRFYVYTQVNGDITIQYCGCQMMPGQPSRLGLGGPDLCIGIFLFRVYFFYLAASHNFLLTPDA